MKRSSSYVWQQDSIRSKLMHWLRIKLECHLGQRWLFPGLMTLMSLLYRILKPKGRILTSVRNFKILLRGKDDVMTPEILTHGCHEPSESQVFLDHVKPGMTILDIGANIGYFSLLVFKKIDSGKVYAFEPEPNNYATLTDNIALNHARNIVAVPKALSNQKGSCRFFLDEGNFGAHTFSSSNIQTQNRNSIEVETIPLDDFVRDAGIRVDFIKMDVQGAEGLVLEKATETLKRDTPKILMEFWPEGLRNLKTDPLSLLRQLAKDYEISLIGHPGEALSKMAPEEILPFAEQHTYVNLFCTSKKAAS
jgi:FkbM family methyltransferase